MKKIIDDVDDNKYLTPPTYKSRSMTINTEEIKSLMPSSMKSMVTDEFIMELKRSGEETNLDQEQLEEMFVNYSNSLKGVKGATPNSYLSALKFCSLIVDTSLSSAWKQTFPEKWNRLKLKGKEDDATKLASAYFKQNEMVKIISKRMLTASYIQYAPLRDKAMNHLYDLMQGKASPYKVIVYEKGKDGRLKKDRDGNKIQKVDSKGEVVFSLQYPTVSPNVQFLAASKILDETKVPEENIFKIEHSISDEQIELQKETIRTFKTIGKNQREALINGSSIEDVQVIGHALSDKKEIEE